MFDSLELVSLVAATTPLQQVENCLWVHTCFHQKAKVQRSDQIDKTHLLLLEGRKLGGGKPTKTAVLIYITSEQLAASLGHAGSRIESLFMSRA